MKPMCQFSQIIDESVPVVAGLATILSKNKAKISVRINL